MKTFKSLTMVLGLLLAATMTSCKPEPIEEPSSKLKVKQIYYSDPQTDKTPFQSWDWSEDHLVSITHYSDSYLKKTWIETFTYENDKIIRVDNLTYDEHINYSYNEDQLKTATVFEDNDIICSWSISYDNNKISKLQGTFFDYYFKNKGSKKLLNPLSHLFPHNICECLETCQKQLMTNHRGNRNEIMNIILTWTGDNISKIIVSFDDVLTTLVMEYDDKQCPMYGMTGNLEDYIIGLSMGSTSFSKNNVKQIIFTEDDETDTIHFAYQYNNENYPILETMYDSENEDYKNVFYYEY